ncbi:hypothetical protein BJ166DRAFT_504065 [Pestalotiopsis sp. NC0098]|nr:hypothetical protein BJ166DRAFT_504065 [Pestalotiopsis sp. NC0098]
MTYSEVMEHMERKGLKAGQCSLSLEDVESDVNLLEAAPLPACITYRTPFLKIDSLQLPDDQHLTALALQWFDQQQERATTSSDNETVRVFRQGLNPTGLEFQLSDTPSFEAVIMVPIPPSFSPMENISYRTSLLNCWGRKFGWQSNDIHQAALELPDQVNYVNAEDALLLRQHCMIMRSLHNKARYDLTPDAKNPRFEMAIQQLRQAIESGYEHGNISIDLQDQVHILKSWYEEINNPQGVQWCKKNQDKYDEQLLHQRRTDAWLLRDRF